MNSLFTKSFVVPFSSPINVTVFPYSSTAIRVMWKDIQEIDRNGVIVAYEILYVPLNQFNGVLVQGIVSVSASNRSSVLRGLEEYVQYNISVRARTSVGPGPYSTSITERTLQNGRVVFIFFFWSLIIFLCIYQYPPVLQSMLQ